MKKNAPIVLTAQENSLLDIHQGLIASFNKKIIEATDIVEDVINYYQSIILCMPGNVYWMDKNCKAVGCNHNVLELHGLQTLKDFQGLSFEEMGKLGRWNKEQTESFKNDTLEVIRTGRTKAHVEEPSIPGPDGNDIYFLTTRVPLFNSKREVIGVVGISTDITAQKEAEQREKLSIASEAEARGEAKAEAEMRQAVTVLTGSIVHDLRTPLMIFKANARYLKQNVPLLVSTSEKTQTESAQESSSKNAMQLKNIMEALDDLESSAKQMSTFIDSTLKMLSKTTVGKFDKEDLTPCFINKCISYTLDSYPFSKEERLLVEWNRSDDYCFMGNEVLFVRILYNLIKNALYQISKNQRGKIIITTECGAESNILRFRDTAGGAEPAVVDRLFQGYETTKTGGTGVGLAYCQQVMTSFGGQISCHSEYGDYIEFVMTFPVA